MGVLFDPDKDISLIHIVPTLAILVVGITVACLLWIPIYNTLFHPLRSYPGPKLWGATRIPYTLNYISGHAPKKILELHDTYGPVVRVAPDFISYNHPDASKQIRGHRKAGMPEHGKDPVHVRVHLNNVLGADRETHTRHRRILAHGFSNQAMLNQEPMIKKYVDMLFERLTTESAGGTKALDMVKWYNYTTFDIIGDLAFGEPFGCLETSTYHPWVSLIYTSIKNRAFFIMAERLPGLTSILKRFVPKEIATKWAEHTQLSEGKVRKRLATVTDRPDFIHSMTQPKRGSDEGLSFDEIAANASVLIIAGSETTATALSAATYFLGSNPRALSLVTEEVRTMFPSEEDITLISVQKLPYMLAVLDETLRMYPPAPITQPRRIAEGGDTILGRFVPANTKIEFWPAAIYRSSQYLTQPNDFIPERWLGDQRFAKDRMEIIEPFSSGPRNCIGKNLAYAEMRLILARLLWKYDIQLSEDSKVWAEKSKIYTLWEKGPVNVYLRPRTFHADVKE
ncbi:cytochrome P450 monooxygenase [Xylogone sp. PMI_703]|nr:cytochrome P450 monooxygenase [Xylogone sp. PMI_703]